jgi:hypothetical protein
MVAHAAARVASGLVKKAWLIAAVAVLAAAGALAAVIVSSRDDKKAQPGTSESSRLTLTTESSTRGTTSTGTTNGSTNGLPPPTTTTSPVPATTSRIPPPPSPHSGRKKVFTVGVVDDSLAQQDPNSARLLVNLSYQAGFDAVVVSATWARGRTHPQPAVVRGIGNVARAARAHHMRLFIVAWNGFSMDTPRNGVERGQFATFAASLVKAFPTVHAIVVGNEPNLSTFWMPQFGRDGRDVAASAYEDLLARSYDAIKAASSQVEVVGLGISPHGADRPHGIRPTHSPTAFIRDLGSVYRASGRRRPLMDAFAIHPYMSAPKIPPNRVHPKTTEITIADYPKLVTLLDEAFRHTPQRGRTLPIMYTEFGVQTIVPDDKITAYQAGTSPKAGEGVSSATQAAYYREALALAYCQSTVRGLFIFHTFDEPALNGWQSGLYYADRTAKPSLRGFRRAVGDLRDGKLTNCGR